MAISFQTNVASMVAATNLSSNQLFQSKTIERLTSGYRINSSGDDAAGLAVANQYRSNVAELNQGVRNANDGNSTLQIIDGGLGNISTMLDRMKTLATQSASTTFTGNRTTLDTEYQTLLGEINRQASNIGLSSTNGANATQLSVFIGGGASALSGSQVNVNLTQGKVDSGALGLSGTNVGAAAPVTIGGGAGNTMIAAGSTETFTVNTGSGSATVSVVGQATDTAVTQLARLNSALGAYNVSASLDSSGKLAFSSSAAFSVSITGAGLAAGGEAGNNTALNNQSVTLAAGSNTFDVTEGTTVAHVTLAYAGTDAANMASLNSQLAAAGINDITAVQDSSAAHKFSLQSASTFSTASTAVAVVGGYTAATGGG